MSYPLKELGRSFTIDNPVDIHYPPNPLKRFARSKIVEVVIVGPKQEFQESAYIFVAPPLVDHPDSEAIVEVNVKGQYAFILTPDELHPLPNTEWASVVNRNKSIFDNPEPPDDQGPPETSEAVPV